MKRAQVGIKRSFRIYDDTALFLLKTESSQKFCVCDGFKINDCGKFDDPLEANVSKSFNIFD